MLPEFDHHGDGVPRALLPDLSDGRLARLGKLAALHLIMNSRPVTRTTLAAASKYVDDEPTRAKRGFSEASLDTNMELRKVYEASRAWAKPIRFRRRGPVDAQIARMTKREIVTALLLARLAMFEREQEFALARARYGHPIDTSRVTDLRQLRRQLKANRERGCAPAALLGKRRKVGASNRARVREATKRECDASKQAISLSTGLHIATVERHLSDERRRSDDAALGIDPEARPALMRLCKWDLARALHIDRDLIRTLNRLTLTMAVSIVARERQEIRAERASGSSTGDGRG